MHFDREVSGPDPAQIPLHWKYGFSVQPDSIEGDILLKTPLPRGSRSEFPPGRGMYIARGKVSRVQLPLL